MSTLPTPDAYIFFTDIKGESGDEKHKDWTAVHSFKIDVINNINKSNQGTGLGGGIVEVSNLHLNLLFDKSAITLRKYVVSGKHIKEVKLHVRRQGGSQESWYELTLTQAMVADARLVYGDSNFYCDVQLAFQKHKESYFPQDFQGKKGAEVTYTWDSYTNKLE
ncbi:MULTISPECIES: Hcp family type VI secretion system effector [Xenorhabdus]|uniref:Hcp family type VI secretion system effector n=1 Tax=Xenorhabdus TaxID=626 RepID=UPI000C04B785|nr:MULTISPECIES: type VI secretion system tube protein Hcp [unclassified Xenorhabdus]MCC8378259.1 type VI secretion system tube protein Hcp [Xenorhabdus sp. PB30.3]PHM56592.1 cytoplasmic protein [Xenorhabdus sp. KK7.4]